MIPRLLGLLFILASLTGCGIPQLAKEDVNSVYYLPPVGSTIKLKQGLSVPPGHTRVFLQRGEVVPKQSFDRYYPYCNFEIRTLADTPRSILPEDFLVVRVQIQTTEIVEAQPVQLAALWSAGGMDDGLPLVARGVHLWVGSDKQPDVMRLTCYGAFDNLPDAEPPSITDMRKTLGEVAELILP